MMAAALKSEGNIWAGYRKDRMEWIAVGMPLSEHPPHRSQRAQFTHWAPTLGV